MCIAIARADEAQTKPAGQSPLGLTVAILDFETDTPRCPELGSQISETLSATLTARGWDYPGGPHVDREGSFGTFDKSERPDKS